MSKKKLRIIVITVLIMLIIVLLSICLYVNKETLISRITGKNHILKAGESNTSNIDTSKWDLEKVNVVYDKDNVPVPVPKGYVASNVENGVTPMGQVIEEENRVNTGFVIYEMTVEEVANNTEVNITKDNFWEESQKRNQWVWVPVLDPSRIYERDSSTGKIKSKLYNYTTTGRTKRGSTEPRAFNGEGYDGNEKNFLTYDMQGMTNDKLLQELEIEYEATIESIEKYGGFYIGRYETGNVGSGSKSNHNSPRQPVVQRMNTNINFVTWYDAYNNIKNIQRNENIKSNIIWGCLWDETLQWLVDSGSKKYADFEDFINWGNHYKANFDYIGIDGKIAHKNANIGELVPTGSSERNKANNIYNMAGNVFEATLERYTVNQSYSRGGYCEVNNYKVSSRVGRLMSYYGSLDGVRAYMYIK